MHANVLNPQFREPEMARLALRLDQLAKFRRLKDVTIDSDFASRIGVNPSQVSRVLTGKAAPGTRFIAGVLELFGVDTFADLFSVVPDDDGEAA
jgi:transcriptional regulator with XRE-family HTH domain